MLVQAPRKAFHTLDMVPIHWCAYVLVHQKQASHQQGMHHGPIAVRPYQLHSFRRTNLLFIHHYIHTPARLLNIYDVVLVAELLELQYASSLVDY